MRLWGIDTSRFSPNDALGFEVFLDEPERHRAARFGAVAYRATYVLAHASARLLLSSMSGVDPGVLALRRTRRGKPFIDPAMNACGIRFSIAHTDGFAAVAAAFGRDVGVDVEAIDRSVEGARIAQRHFTPRERRELAELEGEAQHDRFFAFWTMKEAVLKAAGTGLHTPLDALDVYLAPARIATRHAALAAPGGWSVETFRPTRRHLVALAHRPGQAETTC